LKIGWLAKHLRRSASARACNNCFELPASTA
jgi:hypothetical protein